MDRDDLDRVSGEGVFAAPDIPRKKLLNALKSYAPGIMPDEVWILVDDSAFGSAKDGMLVTADSIYCKAAWTAPVSYRLDELHRITHMKKTVYVNSMKFFSHCVVAPSAMEKVVDFIIKMKESASEKAPYPAENNNTVQLETSKQIKSSEPVKSTMEETPTRTKERNEFMSIRRELREAEKKDHSALILYGIVALIISGAAAIGMKPEIEGFWTRTLIVMVTVIGGVPGGIIGGLIGKLIGNIARPDVIFTTGGGLEILKAKIFWAIGPQFIGLLVGTILGSGLTGGTLVTYVFKA
jgi:hypothetical protein